MTQVTLRTEMKTSVSFSTCQLFFTAPHESHLYRTWNHRLKTHAHRRRPEAGHIRATQQVLQCGKELPKIRRCLHPASPTEETDTLPGMNPKTGRSTSPVSPARKASGSGQVGTEQSWICFRGGTPTVFLGLHENYLACSDRDTKFLSERKISKVHHSL